jgi:hypothetical protein
MNSITKGRNAIISFPRLPLLHLCVLRSGCGVVAGSPAAECRPSHQLPYPPPDDPLATCAIVHEKGEPTYFSRYQETDSSECTVVGTSGVGIQTRDVGIRKGGPWMGRGAARATRSTLT